jgi:hypothetical protein
METDMTHPDHFATPVSECAAAQQRTGRAIRLARNSRGAWRIKVVELVAPKGVRVLADDLTQADAIAFLRALAAA